MPTHRSGPETVPLASRSPDRDGTSGSYRRTADFRVSTTDPDAKLYRKGAG